MVENQLMVDSYLVDSSTSKPSTRKPSTSKPSTIKPLMLLLLFMAAAVAVIAMVPAASAWDYPRNITINSSQVPSKQTNFPVLLNLSGDWLKTAANGGHINTTDASDVVFTTDSEASGYNEIKLDWEREKYDGAAGTLVAWVRIPTLKSSEDTVIRMWYGQTDPPAWAGPNPTGVWDSNYKSVWHLLGNATALLPDATSNSNTGTKKAACEPANTASGQIDGAQDFDGTDDYVRAGVTSFDSGSGTYESWVNFDAWNSGNTETIFSAPSEMPDTDSDLVLHLRMNSDWIDQSYTTTGTASETIGDTNTKIAQRFVSGSGVTRIGSVDLNQTAGGGLVGNIRIETDNDGEPSGTLVETNAYCNGKTLNADSVTHIPLHAISTISAETAYWIVFSHDSGSGTFQGGTTTSNDQCKYWDGNSWKLSANVENIYFKTYGQTDDVSGSGNNGKVVGASSNTSGKFGRAGSFDGTDDYVNCYDEQTRVLTNNGWKFFKDLTMEDLIATLNPETQMVEWHQPTRYIAYPYGGKMMKINSNDVDLLVTPDHQMYASIYENNGWSKYKLVKAREIVDEKIRMKTPNFSNENATLVVDGNDWVWYDGMVYDITVKNHILLVRRNGRPVWSGNCGNDTSLNITGAITIEAWVKPISYADWDRILAKHWTSDVDPWAIYRLTLTNDSDGLEEADFTITIGGEDHTITSVDGVPLNNWTHIVGTYNGTTIAIYINGNLDSSRGLTGSIDTNGQPVLIGSNLWNEFNAFNGTIDEVRLYSRALSADEVRSHYLGGISMHKNSSNNLVFHAGNATLTTDVSGLSGWHHIAGTYASNDAKLYLDGVQKASDATVTVGGSFGSDSYFGNDEKDALEFDGKMDEVRVSAAVRSGDWIKTGYNNQVDATPGDGKFIKPLGDETAVPEGETPVPDPSAVVLFASGLGMLVVWFGWGKRKRGLKG